MTNAERFHKAMQSILSVPPEKVEEINRETQAAYLASTKGSTRDRKSDSKRNADK